MSQTLVPDSLDIEKLGEVILVPWTWIRPFPGQPREFFDEQELKNLAASIKVHRQKVPALVMEIDNDPQYRYELIDGQRRWHALQMAGKKKMKVIVVTVKDVEEQFLISVLSNFGGAAHGPLEIIKAVSRFKGNGMTVNEIAAVFSKSEAWVYQYLRVAEKLHPDVQVMMSQAIPEDDRLVFSVAVRIADDVPVNLQRQMAKVIVSKKLKTIQAKDYIRRQGAKHGFSVGSPDRTPRKDYRVMCNFVSRLARELGVFTQLPQSFFDKMFEFREGGDHAEMLRTAEKNLENLGVLVLALKRAKKQETRCAV